MRPWSSCLAVSIVAAASLAPVAAAVVVPPLFTDENAVPGITFNLPTSIAFLPGGRMLVAEKAGRVWTVTNGVRYPVPLWEHTAEVLNKDDRGLLGIAVDPAYAANHFIYLLYTVDPDSNGVDDNPVAFGRLARYTVDFSDSNAVLEASRKVLLGTVWSDGPVSASPSHTVGDLEFGADGSLFVSAGDGAYFNTEDAGGRDPAPFLPGRTNPLEDIGAFRAQWIGSLAGKVLRIDPADGGGYPENPYWDGDPRSARSRVWCYGLRNPFRFTVRPGTGSADPADHAPGTLFIGEVGWNTWEEQDVARRGGLNYGWPCYEGPDGRWEYQLANPAHHGCGSIGLAGNPGTLSPPNAWYPHNPATSSTPPDRKSVV